MEKCSWVHKRERRTEVCGFTPTGVFSGLCMWNDIWQTAGLQHGASALGVDCLSPSLLFQQWSKSEAMEQLLHMMAAAVFSFGIHNGLTPAPHLWAGSWLCTGSIHWNIFGVQLYKGSPSTASLDTPQQDSDCYGLSCPWCLDNKAASCTPIHIDLKEQVSWFPLDSDLVGGG